MEDNLNQEVQAPMTPPQSTSFSVEPKSKNSGSKWILIFIGLLILGGAGIFFFTKSGNETIPTPTPTFKVEPIVETETPTAIPTKSPVPVKKSDISIEIQNGTGITGEAALLQAKLKALGYSDIKVGNATSTDFTAAVVTFSKILSQTVQDEIKLELEKLYKEVTVKTSSTQQTDIVIITGPRLNSATTTPKASASPKASTTPTASPVQ